MLPKLDPTDRAILAALQSDASQSLDSIAERLNVSLNTVWRRVRRLETEAVIEKRVALIDNEKIGLPLTAFVQIRTDNHSEEWASDLTAAVNAIPEIVEFYRLAGDVDYILKMMIASVADYDRVYQQLISRVQIYNVSASFAMEKLKFTTELPL
ncbi:ArsR family transcriptional regulator [Algimonas arctica]|uniref:ArsR family transcriptional regulator n=1 Tax=Algimonas arctica TaxID=1479486 RepID=A0A8J3CPT5_9PROT|nr:Lrp/AsnC family transcriptional regulator [Algimonas arctica]GHA83280.1 ArsR family transcriptional regulator [Algimonas arctica]